MRITQGQFSFLPDLTDEEIRAQVDYALSRGWALSVEWTDDPHPRNCYWNMWGIPMFQIKDGAAVLFEVNACRKANSEVYIKVNAFDNTRGVESMVMSFLVQRPTNEPGFVCSVLKSLVARFVTQRSATQISVQLDSVIRNVVD